MTVVMKVGPMDNRSEDMWVVVTVGPLAHWKAALLVVIMAAKLVEAMVGKMEVQMAARWVFVKDIGWVVMRVDKRDKKLEEQMAAWMAKRMVD